MIVMRKRINLAIGIVHEAARAMNAIHAIVLVPVIQVSGLIIFMVFWVIYCFFLASSGDIIVNHGEYVYNSVTYAYNYRTFSYKPAIKYAFIFMVFTMFWTSEFIIAIGQLVIALCFAAYYFTKDKSSVHSDTVLWVSKCMLMLDDFA